MPVKKNQGGYMLMNNRARIGFMLLVLVVVPFVGANAQKRTARKVDPDENNASIMFPAKGHLDVTNGTIEAVFSLAYSFGDQFSTAGSGRRLFSLLSTHNYAGGRYEADNPGKTGVGLHFNVYLGQWQSRDYMFVTSSLFNRPQENLPPARWVTTQVHTPDKEPAVKAGEWHSMAVTWYLTNDTHIVTFYLDGKRVGRGTSPHRVGFSAQSMADNDLLAFGFPGQMYGSLQSVRISGRARSDAEIAAADKAGLAKDGDTLLYFDGASVMKMKVGNASQLDEKKDKRDLRVPPQGMVFGKLKRDTGRNKAPAVKFREILP
jgi:hypothetical protein